MIDELYERHVKIKVSADPNADKLFTSRQLEHEFKRAVRKLYERQTTKYLAAGYIQQR